MNGFEDFIDMLQFEPLVVNSESTVEVICEYTENGELMCETATEADAGEVSSDFASSSDDSVIDADNEVEDIDEELIEVEGFFEPISNIFSMFDSFNPFNYVSYDLPCHEDADSMLEQSDSGLFEVEGDDYYDDDWVVISDTGYMNILDNLYGGAGAGYIDDSDLIVEYDEDVAGAGDFGYFDFGNIFYLESEYAPYDGEYMQVKDEVAFGEAIEWQDQVFGALSFVVLALVLTKVVLFCTRSRSRTVNDRKTPLLTVAVEKHETSEGGETGSYVPPKENVATKAVATEKMDKGPYIVFI